MMTISDFFLIQTTSEIKDQFEKIGLSNYRDVPEDIQSFCNKFNLLNDERCKNFYVYKRRSTAEISVYLSLPNPSFPECPIEISAEFYAKSKAKGCSITRGEVLKNGGHTNVFRKVSDIFDSRPDYNNIEYDVYIEWLINVREPKIDYKGNTFYVLNKNKTLLDLYDSICQHVIGVAPLIKMFVSSTEDGSWEKIWDSLMPREKWNRGNDIMKGMFSSTELSQWYRAVKAGIKPKIEEFIKYYVATCCCQIGFTLKGPLDDWNSNDKDAVDLFEYILSEFDKKYVIDNSMEIWNKAYSGANKEFVDEVNLLRTKLSQKYNINEKYIDINKLFSNKKDFNWTTPNVPNDAYLK